ncbi:MULTISPECIES: sporulation initiation factor Spo0A C-terminal domain-containing protein [Eubacteriales]|uniref:Stage 0 sporulation protein A homolog n=1 Tax=Bittarella massiliensis (ex Durand et al. 2017) TaxID=1720313 RepID=A0AAQ1MAZ1_9FIRM|nr:MULTISPECIES: sporulation initiation factor Spo0A C-terminal domain-containing protein [Eubacteriales]ERI98647.1 response regulator receiver domain protein [Clostridium sp. ATCC 29733]MZL68594.1 response regulator [Bittarella massiliensis (ex Durand et al. 2017)]MZL79351.1 response regulator [Bittarella massiliensis (ex Durand et al. 2017)]SHF66222.1 DNA-binding response regulator, NarL/FixJ family, contains REC and HTH domains [Bittarella massiliensis (ex Durand et al. 2017)]
MDDKISLLIVEDEPAEQAAFAECLQNECQIELVGITGSETEALALVDSYRPDVVILDLELQEGDGLSLTPALTDPSRPYSPYVLVTTRTENRHTLDMLRDAGVGFIYDKNIERYGPDQVLRGVKRMGSFLKGRRLGRSGEAAAEKEAAKLRRERLIEELCAEMEDMGLCRRRKNCRCLVWAVYYQLQHREPLSLGKELYPMVAKELHCEPDNVERNIRSAIEKAWDVRNERLDLVYARFPLLVKKSGKLPTNSELIEAFVVRMRRKHAQ